MSLPSFAASQKKSQKTFKLFLQTSSHAEVLSLVEKKGGTSGRGFEGLKSSKKLPISRDFLTRFREIFETFLEEKWIFFTRQAAKVLRGGGFLGDTLSVQQNCSISSSKTPQKLSKIPDLRYPRFFPLRKYFLGMLFYENG